MKLKLIYDTNSVYEKRFAVCNEIGIEDDDDGEYCSDYYVNSGRNNNEYFSILHKQIAKYFRGHGRCGDMHLVDIPDEIMLQYMLEGVYDMDWIAYDINDHRICISNTSRGAIRYGEETRYGRGGSGSGSSSNHHFFTFNVNTESDYDVQNDTRANYMIVPDGEHYKNIQEVLEPYIQFRFVQYFQECSDLIRSTQDFGRPDSRSNDPIYGGDEVWYEDNNLDMMLTMKRVFHPDESNCRNTWNLRYETFVMCLQFWADDHPTFVAAKPYLSDYVIESFRLMDARIKNKVYGTNQ